MGPDFLRPDVYAEPLVASWYAWSHLIAPAPAAMYVANSHVKLMQSFAANPQIHVAALQNPAMRGGPFINHPPERAGEVEALLRRTLARQAPQLELAAAIKQADELLSRADGGSLEPLYRELPAALKGKVELVYDLNHRASLRFIEPLLYQSPFHDPGLQSVVLKRLTHDDERPFVFSTPRLRGEGERRESVELELPFSDPRLDALFGARTRGASVEALVDAFHLEPERAEVFRTFFTNDAPPPPERFQGPGMRVRYLGHACLLIETPEVTLLTDPVLGYVHGGGAHRLGFADLPERIDYVLLTHNHLDHVVFEILLQLRQRIGAVIIPRGLGGSLVDPSLRRVLRQIGFGDVREVDELERLEIPGGDVTAVPFLGEHADLDVRTKSAYLVRAAGRSVLAVADLNNVAPEVYDLVSAGVGKVDVLFIGMECEGAPLSWSYGALLTRPLGRKLDQTRRFSGSNCESAQEIVKRFSPGQVYVYAMGQEPWLTFLTSIRYTPESRPIVESDRLIAHCRAQGLPAERLLGTRDILL